MSDLKNTHHFFDVLAKVLLRCTILGFLLLLFWFGVIMIAKDLTFAVHGSMFHVSYHELEVIHYCGMGLLKLVIGCCFLIPWIAIRMVVKSEGS
jgi:hypothetical protein